MPTAEQYVIPPADFILVSSATPTSDVTLPANCRGLLVGTAGTINITMSNGSARDGVPFLQGITPGFFATVRTGGTAQNIWALV